MRPKLGYLLLVLILLYCLAGFAHDNVFYGYEIADRVEVSITILCVLFNLFRSSAVSVSA